MVGWKYNFVLGDWGQNGGGVRVSAAFCVFAPGPQPPAQGGRDQGLDVQLRSQAKSRYSWL